MIKILFSIFTEGFPNKNIGGPNSIIYDLIKNSKSFKYKFDYLSYDYFISNINSKNIDSYLNPKSKIKYITNNLFENYSFYRKIFQSNNYLPFHYKKKKITLISFFPNVKILI